MNRLFVACLVSIALAGCAEQDPPPEPASASETIPQQASLRSEVVNREVSCAAGQGFNQLPAGVCLADQYMFVDQRDYVGPDGSGRRRLTFGYHGIDQADVVDEVAKALVAAGYRRRDGQVKADGASWVPFTKSDLGTTYLEVLPPSNSAEAEGQFFVDFRSGTP